MEVSELLNRCRDEAFWTRLPVQQRPSQDLLSNQQSIESLISERDVCLRIASECGLLLLHLLDVSNAEVEAMRSQLEAHATTALNNEFAIAEKQQEINHLTKKTSTLTTQLNTAESRIHQLQSIIEKNSSKTNTHTTTMRILSPDSPNPPPINHEAKALRLLQKQHKETIAAKIELEMQVDRLSEEISAYKTQLQTRRPSKAASSTSPERSISPNNQPDVFLALIRELSAANSKLEKEKAEIAHLLESSQTELSVLKTQLEEAEYGGLPLHTAQMSAIPLADEI
ncbi:hypothetical protein HDU79_004845, partial [Rhizoclosmatium sp. JEL0117]